MNKSDFNERLFFKYLKLLGIQRQSPSFEYLKEIVKGQLAKSPFEKISKLDWKKRLNLNQLIDFELYLDGIEKYNFGGTCYANNFYLNQLLPQYDDVMQKQEDYWATPKEFLIAGYGDCEDYVIIKYFTLIKLGFDKNKLFLTIFVNI